MPEGPIYYPYIEGISDSLTEALAWIHNPPPALRAGLTALAAGGNPANLVDVVMLFGQFKERLGVLYARDINFAAFQRQHKSGRAQSDFALIQYVASYMMAIMRKENEGIKHGRYFLLQHAKNIVFNNENPPDGLTRQDFEKLLTIPPLKPGQTNRSAAKLNEKVVKQLSGPKLDEWADELLIFKIQEYTPRP